MKSHRKNDLSHCEHKWTLFKCLELLFHLLFLYIDHFTFWHLPKSQVLYIHDVRFVSLHQSPQDIHARMFRTHAKNHELMRLWNGIGVKYSGTCSHSMTKNENKKITFFVCVANVAYSWVQKITTVNMCLCFGIQFSIFVHIVWL